MGEEFGEIFKKPWAMLILGVFLGLISSALILLVCAPPLGSPIQLLPSPTARPLTVHVSGAVANPGVYTFAESARIDEALQAAGGALPSANTEALNRAEFLQDGQKIYVPRMEETPPAELIQGPSSGAKVNLNTATQAELETLSGIGPSKAADIITYRQKTGGFDTIEEIQQVPGIGAGLFESIKDSIYVTP